MINFRVRFSGILAATAVHLSPGIDGLGYSFADSSSLARHRHLMLYNCSLVSARSGLVYHSMERTDLTYHFGDQRTDIAMLMPCYLTHRSPSAWPVTSNMHWVELLLG